MRWGWWLGGGTAVVIALIVTLVIGAVVGAEIEQNAVRAQLSEVTASCGPVAAAITADADAQARVAALAPAIRPYGAAPVGQALWRAVGQLSNQPRTVRIAVAKIAGPVCAALDSWAPVPSTTPNGELAGGQTR
ncbi:MAG: hypothetical protein ABSG43_03465 [Solirubrobacteraceae bacterium]